MFGIFGLVFIVMFQSITINNESEYYVLKEAMEAAMLESIDLACYRMGDDNGCIDEDGDGNLDIDINGKCIKKACGSNDVKIIEQKFVENFTRRFAASISGDVTEYELEFYDIMEMPPKVTVVIKAKTQEYLLGPGDEKSSFSIVNELSGILELNHNDINDNDTSDDDLKGNLGPIKGGNPGPINGGSDSIGFN